MKLKEHINPTFLFSLVMGILIAALIFFFLSSCVTSQKQAQRKINRLVSKYPDLVLIDTLTQITERFQTDTIFKPGRDTVIIKEGKLTIKHFYDRSVDTVFIEGECEADTVRLPGKILKVYPTTGEMLKNLWWVWLVVISVLVIAFVFKK